MTNHNGFRCLAYPFFLFFNQTPPKKIVRRPFKLKVRSAQKRNQGEEKPNNNNKKHRKTSHISQLTSSVSQRVWQTLKVKQRLFSGSGGVSFTWSSPLCSAMLTRGGFISERPRGRRNCLNCWSRRNVSGVWSHWAGTDRAEVWRCSLPSRSRPRRRCGLLLPRDASRNCASPRRHPPRTSSCFGSIRRPRPGSLLIEIGGG